MTRRLFLVPNFISENNFDLPASLASAIAHLRLFFVEEPKSARRLLKHINSDFSIQACRLLDLNEHTKPDQLKGYLELLQKEDAAVISESGCPCVADPGSDLVLLAQQNNIEVVPLVGPSSILLALMASGLSGQNFAFNGYLPKEQAQRIKKIRDLEKRAAQEGQSQIFMETPYRNQALFEELLAHLQDKTLLCVALDIRGPEQVIRTKTVEQWRKSNIPLPKKPALFIINK